MPLKGKYLKYKPEITIEIFKLIYQKLFENKLVDSLDYVDGEYKFFSTSFNILKLPTGANRVGCYAQNWELFKETTVQEILGYDPFVNEEFVLPKKWCCKTDEKSLNDLSRFIKCNGYTMNPKLNQYIHWPFTAPDSSCFVRIQNGYTEITFDQFKKYVLQDSTEKDWTKATKEELLEEAKRKYPIGTKFKSFDDNLKTREVQCFDKDLPIKFYISSSTPRKSTLEIRTTMKTYDKFCSNPSIFSNGEWAEIVSLSEEKEIIPEYVEYNKIIYKVKEWTSHSYCRLENGQEPFKKLVKSSSKADYDAQNQPKQPLKQAVHCTAQEEWDFVLSKINYKLPKDTFRPGCDSIVIKDEEDKNNIGCVATTFHFKGIYQILSFQEWYDLNGYIMEKEVKFEVGEWVCNKSMPFIIGKIDQIKGELVHYRGFDEKEHIRHATPEEINQYLISIGEIPSEEPLDTGIEPNKDDMFRYKTNVGSTFVGNCSTLTDKIPVKPKLILSIDDEELPMVNIIKTNSIKQLLNND